MADVCSLSGRAWESTLAITGILVAWGSGLYEVRFVQPFSFCLCVFGNVRGNGSTIEPLNFGLNKPLFVLFCYLLTPLDPI